MQHRQTGEVHYHQYSKKKHQQNDLLSNTKLTENIIQLVVVGDFAGDRTEVVEATTNSGHILF